MPKIDIVEIDVHGGLNNLGSKPQLLNNLPSRGDLISMNMREYMVVNKHFFFDPDSFTIFVTKDFETFKKYTNHL